MKRITALFLTGALSIFIFTGCATTNTPELEESSEQEVVSMETVEPQDNTEVQENEETSDMSGTTDLAVQREELNTQPIQQGEGYSIYELGFERDGLQIYGNLYLPQTDDQTYPTVIMAHGFGGTYSYMAPYAEILAANGIASYVFDFCGGSRQSRSDGDMLEMSVLTEREDLNAILDGIKNYRFVDGENVFLMGESQGGMVSALLAAQRTSDIRGLILLYPAFIIPDNARAEYSDLSEVPATGQVFGIPVGRVFFEDVINMNVYDEISDYGNNVIIIHGTADELVPLSYSERAVETYSSAQLTTVDNAGHGFYGEDLETVSADIIDFVKQNEQ